MLSVLKEGDIFGELAIVSQKPRNATAISFGTAELLPIDQSALLNLINQSPNIMRRIFVSISQRIWFNYIRLDVHLFRQPITRLYSFLESKLLEEHASLKDERRHVFTFGIDELLRMTGTSQAAHKLAIDKMLCDRNIEFNFGQITVKKSRSLSAKARYYRNRDDIITEETRLEDSSPPKQEAEETLDCDITEEIIEEQIEQEEAPKTDEETPVPEETEEEKETSSVLKELDDLQQE